MERTLALAVAAAYAWCGSATGLGASGFKFGASQNPPWLPVCGGVCPRWWQPGGEGPLAAAGWYTPHEPSLANPRVLLVPRRAVMHRIAQYLVETVCDFEAHGWIVLDMDAVIQSNDVAGDLGCALAAAGVGGSATPAGVPTPAAACAGATSDWDWASLPLLLLFPQAHHFQLWDTLWAYPGPVTALMEVVERGPAFGNHAGFPVAFCLAVAAADRVFVRYREVAAYHLLHCPTLLEGAPGAPPLLEGALMGPRVQVVLSVPHGATHLFFQAGDRRANNLSVHSVPHSGCAGPAECRRAPQGAAGSETPAGSSAFLGAPGHGGLVVVRADPGVLSWATRNSRALTVGSMLVDRPWEGDCLWLPLSVRANNAIAASKATVMAVLPHPGWFNTTLDPVAEQRWLAGHMARTKIMVVSGLFQQCWRLRCVRGGGACVSPAGFVRARSDYVCERWATSDAED
jgi:hypothetical protein